MYQFADQQLGRNMSLFGQNCISVCTKSLQQANEKDASQYARLYWFVDARARLEALFIRGEHVSSHWYFGGTFRQRYLLNLLDPHNQPAKHFPFASYAPGSVTTAGLMGNAMGAAKIDPKISQRDLAFWS